MPPLEDSGTKFEYNQFGTAEVPLPVEARAKLILTFLRATASPDAVELGVNRVNRPKSDNEAKQPERLENRNNDSLPPTTNMGGYLKVVKPDTKACDPIARLRLRNRLRELAEKRC